MARPKDPFRSIVKRSEVVPIDRLRTHPDNPNNGDVDAIGESLDALGQFRGAVWDESSGWLLAGNHTKMTAEAKGWGRLRVDVVNCEEVAAELGMEADEVRTAIMLWDNSTARRARPDLGLEIRLYQRLEAREALMPTFAREDLDRLLDKQRKLEPPADFPDVTHVETDHQCPSCGYQWSGRCK